MNLQQIIEQKEKARQGKSFAILAERTETTQISPYRINIAQNIKADDTTVLVLGGAGGKGYHISQYNGYLKKVDNFVKNHPELSGQNIRVCVAICSIGNFHKEKIAREQLFFSAEGKEYPLNYMSQIQKEEILNPEYIKDIFSEIILPRISKEKGTKRLSKNQAMKNIRRLNIVTHCHGGYVAIRLEQMMLQKMTDLGYTEADKKQIVQQLFVLNYAPDCPQYIAQSQFISIDSASDDHNKYQSIYKEYLQMLPQDFGIIRLPKYRGNVLMCTKVDKSGIEGNPPRQIILQKIDESNFLLNNVKDENNNFDEPKEIKTIGEHDFLGFTRVDNMSNGAQKLQLFANNILKNSLLNSLQQSDGQITPLPSVKKLACDTKKQYAEFAQAYLKGMQIDAKLRFSNKDKLYKFIAYHQHNRIDLGD